MSILIKAILTFNTALRTQLSWWSLTLALVANGFQLRFQRKQHSVFQCSLRSPAWSCHTSKFSHMSFNVLIWLINLSFEIQLKPYHRWELQGPVLLPIICTYLWKWELHFSFLSPIIHYLLAMTCI
jgi:hypothetical protein